MYGRGLSAWSHKPRIAGSNPASATIIMIAHQVQSSNDLFVYEYDLSNELNFTVLTNNAKKIQSVIDNYEHRRIHNAYMSGYSLHTQTNEFDTLISLIESKANELASNLLSGINIKASFKILESWIMSYNKMGYMEKHNHFPFGYSSVCYLSAEDTASIHFHDLIITPSTGKLLIFPGLLSHKVATVLPRHTERIAFVSNIYPTFDYSYFEQLNNILT